MEIELIKAAGPVRGRAAQVALLRKMQALLERAGVSGQMPSWQPDTPITEVIAWCADLLRNAYPDNRFFISAHDPDGNPDPSLRLMRPVPESDYCSIVHCDFLPLVGRRFPALAKPLLAGMRALTLRGLETWDGLNALDMIEDEADDEDNDGYYRAVLRDYQTGIAAQWHARLQEAPPVWHGELAQEAARLLRRARSPHARRICAWLLNASDLLARAWNMHELATSFEYEQLANPGSGDRPAEYERATRFLWGRRDVVTKWEEEYLDSDAGEYGTVGAVADVAAEPNARLPVWPALLTSLMTDLGVIADALWEEEDEQRRSRSKKLIDIL